MMDTREALVETSRDAATRAWEIADALGVADDDLSPRETTKAICAALNGVRVAILATLAEPAPSPIQAEAMPALASWGDLELMGHRRRIGFIEEDELAGRRMLRIRSLQRADRAPGLGEPTPPLELAEDWEIYSPAAVFSFRPLTEDEARKTYLRHSPQYGDPRDQDDHIAF